MNVELTIKNYRCFPDSHPLRFDLREGFTAFVGINNSGKSSVLRFFYELRNFFTAVGDRGNLLNILHGGVTGFAPQVSDPSELFSNLNERPLEIEIAFPNAASHPNPLLSSICFVITRDCYIRVSRFNARGTNYLPNGTYMYINHDAGLLQLANPPMIVNVSGLIQLMTVLASAMYIGPFRNAVNIGTNENYFDIQIGQAFIRTWRNYKTGKIKKHNEFIKRVTRDIGAIFDLELEINPTPDDETLQLFIGDRSFRLNEVGAGIAQFILVIGAAAIRSPSMLFIDEPELNLHPSLQLGFLTTLASYCKGNVVFSSHSLGLARAIADRVYAVRRIEQGDSEVRSLEGTPRYGEFLGELSFNGYQELGFDHILLVEGSTEVRTIQQFLRALKIDHKLVLLPLGGSGMINGFREPELLELKRISSKISALIDSERDAENAPLPKDRAEFMACCARAQIQCHVLERRAIENYFSKNAIQNVKGTRYEALGFYQPLQRASLPWAKSENWLIAREMTLAELSDTDLLFFLKNLRGSIEES